MPQSINLSMYPPTGYVFTDTDGTRHRAAGWKSLEKTVASYRVRNGRQSGNVWQEIMDQVCAAIPGHCHDDAPRSAPARRGPRAPSGNNLGSRVLAWVGWVLKERRDGRLSKVARSEAVRRAAICKACPRQAPLLSGCSTCSGTIATGRRVVLSGETPADDSLQGCTALIEDTKLSVHLVLAPSTNKTLPVPCWRSL